MKQQKNIFRNFSKTFSLKSHSIGLCYYTCKALFSMVFAWKDLRGRELKETCGKTLKFRFSAVRLIFFTCSNSNDKSMDFDRTPYACWKWKTPPCGGTCLLCCRAGFLNRASQDQISFWGCWDLGAFPIKSPLKVFGSKWKLQINRKTSIRSYFMICHFARIFSGHIMSVIKGPLKSMKKYD